MSFMLKDLSTAGVNQISDVDFHRYLFDVMDATMLLNAEPRVFTVNFQNFIRLYTNAINDTIEERNNFFKWDNFIQDDFLFFI